MNFKKRRIAKQIHLNSLEFKKSHREQIKATKVSQTNLSKEKIEEILNATVVELKIMLKNDEFSSEDLVNIFT